MPPILTKRIGLIAGVFLAILAIILTKLFLDKKSQEMEMKARRYAEQVQKNQTAVLVANQDIPQGVLVDVRMFEAAVVPNQHLIPRSVSSFDRIAGMATIAPIAKGEQVSLTKLMPAQRQGERVTSLASVTPLGKRAVTIPVDNISAVGGMIKPGDFVDVLGTIPLPSESPNVDKATQEAVLLICQHVQVLAVGQELGAEVVVERDKKQKTQETIAPIVTLALTPQESNFITLVQQQGKIRLTLRAPGDSQLQMSQPASWSTLLRYLNILSPEEPPREEGEPPPQVEIWRGPEKQIVPLSK